MVFGNINFVIWFEDKLREKIFDMKNLWKMINQAWENTKKFLKISHDINHAPALEGAFRKGKINFHTFSRYDAQIPFHRLLNIHHMTQHSLES